MSAIGSRHASCVVTLTRLLSAAVGESALVSVQNPLRLGPYSEPQPDLLLLRARPDAYAASHPVSDDVLLLIEVSDTSLPFDRDVKLPLYAGAGVPEVWIIDLQSDRIEVHRRPVGEAYSEVETVTEAPVRPVAMPELELDPREILPPGRG